MAKKRILIADPSSEWLHAILHAPEASSYEIQTAQEGKECEKKLEHFLPDLLIVDLLLPGKHGIQLLKKVRASDKTHKIGVIITTDQPLLQNYKAAVQEGANYFLPKPFDSKQIFSLVETFFSSGLKPHAYSPSPHTHEKNNYSPHLHEAESYIKFWGTRGSTPVSGTEYNRFGGNTICLEVRHKQHHIIIDAGSGIRPLGNMLLESNAKEYHLFLGHTHWDHIIGFPSFAPLFNPNATIYIYSPVGFEMGIKELLTEIFAYSFFPVRLEEIKAKLIFKEVNTNEPILIGDIKIESKYAFHPGATLCFKISMAKKTFGYVTDNEMLMGYHGHPSDIKSTSHELLPHKELIEFFKDCHLLVHEAQYTPHEYKEKVGWGHSSISNATILIRESGIKEWVVTHHDPNHIDTALFDKVQMHLDILDDCNIPCHMRMAFDGLKIPI